MSKRDVRIFTTFSFAAQIKTRKMCRKRKHSANFVFLLRFLLQDQIDIFSALEIITSHSSHANTCRSSHAFRCCDDTESDSLELAQLLIQRDFYRVFHCFLSKMSVMTTNSNQKLSHKNAPCDTCSLHCRLIVAVFGIRTK